MSPVEYLEATVPAPFADELREAYRNGIIKPINAYAELYLAHVCMEGIDSLDVGQWLRCGA